MPTGTGRAAGEQSVGKGKSCGPKIDFVVENNTNIPTGKGREAATAVEEALPPQMLSMLLASKEQLSNGDTHGMVALLQLEQMNLNKQKQTSKHALVDNALLFVVFCLMCLPFVSYVALTGWFCFLLILLICF